MMRAITAPCALAFVSIAHAALAVLAASCGGSATTAGSHRDALGAYFAASEAQQARALAPDLHARAERAQAQARAAGEAQARADHEAQARLLLEAAIAEAERIEHERAAARARARRERARTERAALERERIGVERRAQREQAAQVARASAACVFGAAECATDAAKTRAERERLRARDAQVLRERAQLMLAAARALGLSEASMNEAGERLARAHDAPPASALTVARAALASAERALGEARVSHGDGGAGARPAETAALIEMARERGLAAHTSEAGVSVALDRVFEGRATRPSARGRAQLEALSALSRAHPHGAIRLEMLEPDEAPAGARRRARVRAAYVAKTLEAATDPDRVEFVPKAAEADETGLRAWFSAYRTQAAHGEP